MRNGTLAVMAVVWAGTAGATPAETVVLEAANMTCPACSITIEKALANVPGVTESAVDTQAATVRVTFDSERTSVSAIARAITEAGSPAKPCANGGCSAFEKHGDLSLLQALAHHDDSYDDVSVERKSVV